MWIGKSHDVKRATPLPDLLLTLKIPITPFLNTPVTFSCPASSSSNNNNNNNWNINSYSYSLISYKLFLPACHRQKRKRSLPSVGRDSACVGRSNFRSREGYCSTNYATAAPVVVPGEWHRCISSAWKETLPCCHKKEEEEGEGKIVVTWSK